MPDYDDYRKGQDQFFRDLEELETIAKASEWERRLQELVERVG